LQTNFDLLVRSGLRSYPRSFLRLATLRIHVVIIIVIDIVLLDMLAATQILQDAIRGAPGVIHAMRVDLDRSVQSATGLWNGDDLLL
jgi:hypothetical protein